MPIDILNDRYKIEQQLAKKSKRITLLATDQQTDQKVVIKILGLATDEELANLPRFRREIATLMELKHPSLPAHLDYFEQNLRGARGFAFVQAYVEAHSLKELMKAGRFFSEREVKQVAQSLLKVLGYLHGLLSPVLHRNIKPSNILLAEANGKVSHTYLVDFGSVQTSVTMEDSSSTIMSSYEYTAPEQFAGNPVAASDLYSVGTSLITMATGTHISELPRQNSRLQFEHNANLSPDLVDWLKRMTELSLVSRFPSVQVATQALEKVN